MKIIENKTNSRCDRSGISVRTGFIDKVMLMTAGWLELSAGFVQSANPSQFNLYFAMPSAIEILMP